MAIEDQLAPKATDRQPMWPEVIAYVQRNYGDAEGERTVTDLIDDMAARDAVGRERYGVPLTSGNGRNHLVDAYQEALDLAVYLRTELDERGITPLAPGMVECASSIEDQVAQNDTIAKCFNFTVEIALQLRGIINNATPTVPT